MDIVYVNGLEVDVVIGVYEWEQRIRQTVVIDLEMAADVAHAARSDDIDDALSYKEVAKRVREFAAASEFKLVETLAERIAELIRNEFAVPWLRLRVNKRGAVSSAVDVGVVVERGRRD